ncbi:transthyretin-like family protein [Pontibacter pudoricolor]|uniref:hypothetical protein n=1 Tax=Pontibacter pudoricolor TaxID=2694930 RepID=UPI0013920561|nr:hypothetical protein [Pontibacter pudoricolor]
MKTSLLCLLILVTLLLSGCHTKTDDFISKNCPGSCTVIKGTLTTDGRSKPLAGIKLEVQWREGDMFSSISRRKAITTTDANGNFELRFLLRDDELPNTYPNNGSFTVKAHVNPENYLTCSGGNVLLRTYDLKRDTTITLDYLLPQKAFVEIQANNLQAKQQDDFVWTEMLTDAPCTTVVSWYTSDTKRIVPVAANQPVVIRTTKRKSGVETITEEVITLAPSKTFNYEFTF